MNKAMRDFAIRAAIVIPTALSLTGCFEIGNPRVDELTHSTNDKVRNMIDRDARKHRALIANGCLAGGQDSGDASAISEEATQKFNELFGTHFTFATLPTSVVKRATANLIFCQDIAVPPARTLTIAE